MVLLRQLHQQFGFIIVIVVQLQFEQFIVQQQFVFQLFQFVVVLFVILVVELLEFVVRRRGLVIAGSLGHVEQ